MKDRGLAADAIGVHFGAGVNISAAIEEETGTVEEAVFGGDVEEGRATESEYAAARLAAIEFWISMMGAGLASMKVASSSVRPRSIGRTPGRS